MLPQYCYSIQFTLTQLSEHLHSPAFAASARHPDLPAAFSRSRKLPLPMLVAALCGFRGGRVQSELDSFFAYKGSKCRDAGLLRHVSDRALAKARSKLHVPALWALRTQLIQGMQDKCLVSLWMGHRLVCVDAPVLAPAQRACHRACVLARRRQCALRLYLPGNEVMQHVAVGPASEGERQMLFDQLDLMRAGDVLVLDRGCPAI